MVSKKDRKERRNRGNCVGRKWYNKKKGNQKEDE